MDSQKKLVLLQTLKKLIPQFRKEGKKIAFTNGCFDILHYGHVNYLEKAKGKNRILIVGVNSDSSVKKIKGPKRPFISQKQRALILAGLASVDFVIIFKEMDPYKIIQSIQPDVLIKGADWKGKKIVGQDFVEAHGGKVELIRYVKNLSTTGVIEKIRKTFDGRKSA